MSEESDLPNIAPGFISVKEAAKILGVSERSVYGYIEERKLPGYRAAHLLMVAQKDVQAFKRGTTGRPRTRVPEWRISDHENVQYMTQVFVQVCVGQEKNLQRKLEEMRKENRHTFPGTVARYFARNQNDTHCVQILLIWRGTVMPDDATRDAALADLRAESEDVLDWGTARIEMHEILMHT
jgi:excisionase family DNA binding protein